MNILGFQKLTTLDYPDTIAAVIFTQGCNFLCPFCHNPLLVLPNKDTTVCNVSEDEVLEYLKKRKSMLQGLCISGGEPLLQPDIESFIKKVKELGLKIKLDTNGCFPEKLKELINNGLIDYVAMDIKNSPEGYGKAIGIPSFDVSPILETAKYLKNCGINYEFRTTLVKELHKAEDLESIGKIFGGNSTLYLQGFIKAESIINDFTNSLDSLTPYSTEEIRDAQAILEKYFESVIIRGL